MEWKVLSKSIKRSPVQEGIKVISRADEIVNILLKNRGINTKKQKEEFFNPERPENITLKKVGLSSSSVKNAVKRISLARRKKERVVVYGDYDADGICATAIMWEALNECGIKALPYIPDRFEEGYGLNVESIQKLKVKNEKLKIIITVDNGIVAHTAVEEAKRLGIDVIITDHHQPGEKLSSAHSVVHTTEIGGAGVAWMLAREIRKGLGVGSRELSDGIDLVAVGTVADQIPLIGANRSFVKHGIDKLRDTKRHGLQELFREAAIKQDEIDTYHIGFVIAPRINAMGRLEHGIDSLRLLCTTKRTRAQKLSRRLGKTNKLRQQVVEDVILHAEEEVKEKKWKGAIIIHHESYHEGVIGLAAAKLVEKYYRPAVVFSRGEDISKASARSISGFNMIEAVRKVDKMLLAGGGHPMAAGFSIETQKLPLFIKKFSSISQKLLNDELLSRKLKVDMLLDFASINKSLIKKLKSFQPHGIGNPSPVFATVDVHALSARPVGSGANHLKMKLEKEGVVVDAIAFNFGHLYTKLLEAESADFAYKIEENSWNGRVSIQLAIKDIKIYA